MLLSFTGKGSFAICGHTACGSFLLNIRAGRGLRICTPYQLSEHAGLPGVQILTIDIRSQELTTKRCEIGNRVLYWLDLNVT